MIIMFDTQIPFTAEERKAHKKFEVLRLKVLLCTKVFGL